MFEHEYSSFAKPARDIKKAEFDFPPGPSSINGLRRSFLFINQYQQILIDLLTAAIAIAVMAILGGPLSDEELLKMPELDWQRVNL